MNYYITNLKIKGKDKMLSTKQIAQIRQFNRRYTQALGILNKNVFDMDLTWPEGRVLIEIGLNHSTTPMTISNNLNLDKSYTSRIINKLVKKDIISKQKSPDDLRSVNLQLTKHGKKIFNDVDQRSNDQIDTLLNNLSDEQKEKYFKDIMEINQLIFGGNNHDLEN